MTLFTWGTVTALGPLRVRLDGDSVAMPITPDSLVDPLTLTVSDRVRCEITNNRVAVLGRAGGLALSGTIAAVVEAALALRTRRNRIINGNFRTNQRGYVSASSLATAGLYAFDRWKSMTTTTSLTFTAAPQGQAVTISSGDQIAQVIERGNLEAATFVLSWEGTAVGRIYKSGGSTPAFAASPIVFANDGLADVVVEFQALAGTATLGKVQLELGSTPTTYEVIPLADELALCQRYYIRFTPGVADSILALGAQQSTTNAWVVCDLPVTMRTKPTATFSNLVYSDFLGFNAALTALALTSASVVGSSKVSMVTTHAANGAANRPGGIKANTVGAFLAFDAEL